jgi:hypothetical protein
MAYDVERATREENYTICREIIGKSGIDLEVEFPTFLMLTCGNRDEVRAELFRKRIYLPIHWRLNNEESSLLSNKILSIPTDRRYTPSDLSQASATIRKLLK